MPERPGLPRRALAELLAAFALIFCVGGGAAAAASGHAEPRPARPGRRLGPGDHGADLRGRAPLGRPHQPGGHDRLHDHAPLPAAARRSPTSRRSSPAPRSPALLLLAAWPDKPGHLGANVASVATGTALLYEIFLSALLMFVIIAVATDTRAVGAAAAIAIGGVGAARHPRRRRRVGGEHEPGAQLRPGARVRHVDALLDLRRRAGRGHDARWRWPTSSSRERLMAHVLFVCLHNAGRSQMSRALFDRAAGGRHSAESAGSDADPAAASTPRWSRSCASSASTSPTSAPKLLTTELAQAADVVVTMGCGDACPFIPGKRYLDWDLPGPQGPAARRRPRHARRDRRARRGAGRRAGVRQPTSCLDVYGNICSIG